MTRSVCAVYQSVMRPTNGEIRKTPASAQAQACSKLKDERGVTVNTPLLQRFSRSDPFPGRSDFDQHPIGANAGLGIEFDEFLGLGDGGVCIEGESRVHLRTDHARYQSIDL